MLGHYHAMTENDALVRWETIRREQLGVATTLLFGLASAALGFCGSLLSAEHAVFGGCGTCFYLLATGTFFVTVLLSIAVTITRLLDFRLTARKLRLEGRGEKGAVIDRLESVTRSLGRCTWRLFYCQLGGFLLGVILLLFALWTIFHERLFP